jgi:general secretion pathway protein B
MSSILDALKKSERQRSLGRDLIFRNASPNAKPRLTGFAVAVLATLLLLTLAIGVLLFSLREPVPPPLATAPVETSAPSAVSAIGADQLDTTIAPASAPDSQARSRIQAAPSPEKPARASAPSSADASRVAADQPVTGTGEAPWLSSLPPAFRSSLPPLAVNIHVYSPDQSQRILYINNRPVQQGARIEGGVVVEEIVHDGVVLQFRGQRFKLPRPS